MKNKGKSFYLIEAVFCVVGFVLFSLFIHQNLPLSLVAFLGILLPAYIISRNVGKWSDVFQLFGIRPFSRNLFLYLVIGSFIGILFGMGYRLFCNLHLLPERLTGFAVVAAGIGSAEEMVFRGFLQGHIRGCGIAFSIVFATLFHAVYKCFLFLSHPSNETDLLFLMFWTIVAGLILGTLREISKNVLPALIAHACFDIIVYGGIAIVPWWVWS